MKYLNVGDKVLVAIPSEDRGTHFQLLKYNNKQMIITRRKPVGRLRTPYYELEGAKSEHGIPYAFVKEWLVEL